MFISQGIKKAISIPRNKLLIPPIKNDEEVIPYVSTYNPHNTEMFSIFKNNLHFLTSDQTIRDALSGTGIIKSKRQPPKLKTKTKKKKTYHKARFTDTRTSTTNFVSKCNRRNCGLCECLDESNSYNFNGKIFYVNETMSCDVRNVIYVITSNRCNEYYIGQTAINFAQEEQYMHNKFETLQRDRFL